MNKWVVVALVGILLALVSYGVWQMSKTSDVDGPLVDTAINATIISNETNTTSITATTTTTLLVNVSGNETVNISNETTNLSVKPLSPHEKCLSKFIALKKETIIFRYAPWSSFSSEWEPTVNKIWELNYSIVRAQVGNETQGSFYENEDYMKECFEGVYKSRTIPQFICAGTKDQFIGIEANVYTLRDFAETCRQRAAKTDAEKTFPDSV
ncbi:MAG TPA: hypothetical protein VJJ21_01350 [Candidatus Nanoarchaeia archaeon]|nr:hypothetical protein [Candidatus Nanoarchaeia archaeon]